MSATHTIGILTPISESKARIWTGRVLTAMVVLFLLFDGIMKVIKERHVLQSAAQLGYSTESMVAIGTRLLACTLVYVIPRTAVFGALLLTGYLGAAVATQVRVGNPVFECIFPVIFGVLVWAGLFLREPRLSTLIAARK
jgi:hypothetical protein